MAEYDDDPFGIGQDWSDTEMLPFNIWTVGQAHSMDETGVASSIVLYLASEQQPERIGVVLHPNVAAQIAVDILDVYVRE